MKWLQVALFAAVVLAAHAVTQYSELQLVERALCQFSYQCQDNCFCESPRAGVPKFCFCKHRLDDPGVMACRRSMYL